ncbi:unnamed protein product, partial [marine sediment metagenome]
MIIRYILYIFVFLAVVLSSQKFSDLYSNGYIPPDVKFENSELYDYSGAIHIHTTYSDGSGTPEEV